MKKLALLALFSASACVTPSGGAGRDPSSLNPSQPHPPGEVGYMNAGASPVDAALMTGIAVGASAAQRASGGCYANCPPGTACNPKTGMCDALPCHDACGPDSYCDETGPLPKCVPTVHIDLKNEPMKAP